MTAPALVRPTPTGPVSALAEAAARYAAQGWHVLPLHAVRDGRCSCGRGDCPSPGKHPRLRNGFHDASADAATVARWWQTWPEANIGVVPGRSGLLVLDLDGPDGEATAQALGLLSEPRLQVTTGRGRHLYFRHPGGTISNAKLGPGIDTRGDAGFVVVPPSVHYTGTRYQWLGKVDELTPVPADLVPRLHGNAPAPAGAPAVVPARQLADLEDVAPGGRHDALVRFAGAKVREGHSVQDVQLLTLGLNSQWSAPKPRAEVEAIVAWVAGQEAGKRQAPALDLPPLYTLAEAAAWPELGWTVDGVLPAGGLVQLFGNRNSGKSLIALDLALHVGLGRAWYGRSVTAGSVLYIVAEGVGGFPARVAAWRAHHAPPIEPFVMVTRGGLSVTAPHAGAVLTALCDRLPSPPRLVVIDTQKAATRGTAENEDEGADALLAAIEPVKLLGATVLLVTHPSKANPNSPRGSQVLENAADAVFKVQKDEDTHLMRCMKMRDADEPEDLSFRRVVAGPSVLVVPSTEPADTPAPLTRLLRAVADLDDGGGVTYSNVLAETGFSKATFSRWSSEAQQKKLLVKKRERYSVTTGGRMLADAGRSPSMTEVP